MRSDYPDIIGKYYDDMSLSEHNRCGLSRGVVAEEASFPSPLLLSLLSRAGAVGAVGGGGLAGDVFERAGEVLGIVEA